MVIDALKAGRALITRATGSLKTAVRDTDRGGWALKVINALLIEHTLTILALKPAWTVSAVCTFEIRDAGV